MISDSKVNKKQSNGLLQYSDIARNQSLRSVLKFSFSRDRRLQANFYSDGYSVDLDKTRKNLLCFLVNQVHFTLFAGQLRDNAS